MSSLFLDTKLSTYRAVRAASQGASISLFHAAGEYVAMSHCAMSVASVLGGKGTHIADGWTEYRIPTAEMLSALMKLSQKHSIALLNVVCGDEGSRFVLVWKIPACAATEPEKISEPQPKDDLDGY